MENVPIVAEGQVVQLSPGNEVKFAQEAAQVLMDIVKKNKLSVNLGGKKEHIMFEGWATVARFYGCTIKANDVRPIGEVNADGQYQGFTAHAVVLNNVGREIGGATSACMRDEKNWRNRDNYALMSMAQTRAGAKAARMVFSWVVVLAGYSPTPYEEMPEDERRSQSTKSSTNGQSTAGATQAQLNMIWAKSNNVNLVKDGDDTELRKVLSARYKKESTRDLDKTETKDFIDYLKTLEAMKTE